MTWSDLSTRYSVRTWDPQYERFTPQSGVPAIVHGLSGLRYAIRKLRDLGYTADYRSCVDVGDPFVLITRL